MLTAVVASPWMGALHGDYTEIESTPRRGAHSRCALYGGYAPVAHEGGGREGGQGESLAMGLLCNQP